MGAVLSAVHFGDQYLRSRGARHSDVYLRLWDGAVVDHVWMISGPWNIMNAIAGILNIITICGWFGIFISKDKSRDMIWPDMLWMWIIAYDLWNFAYTYNCMSDHSTYTGLALLIACTVPTFFTKRGAWLQHRAQTLALYAMFAMALPQFYTFAEIPTTHNPTAFFCRKSDCVDFQRGACRLPAPSNSRA